MKNISKSYIGQNLPGITIKEMKQQARYNEFYCYCLAFCYENGVKVRYIDLQEAYNWLNFSINEHKSLWAYSRLALYYFNGWVVEQDYTTAFKMWQTCSEEIDEDLCKREMNIWYDKIHPITKEVYENSTYALGYCYMNGLGIDKDMEAAIMYFEKSLNIRNRKTLIALIHIYSNGIGVPKDNNRAFWYRICLCDSKLATDEDFLNIAACYQHGIGTRKDYKKGFEYLKKAADMNNIEANHLVSRCYAEGLGVAQDIEKANLYLSRALRLNQQLNNLKINYE